MPLIIGGKTKFQPVYVNDVAESIAKIVQTDKFNANIYEMGGPNIYTLRQMIEMILKTLDRKRLMLNIPYRLSSLLGNVLENFQNHY